MGVYRPAYTTRKLNWTICSKNRVSHLETISGDLFELLLRNRSQVGGMIKRFLCIAFGLEASVIRLPPMLAHSSRKVNIRTFQAVENGERVLISGIS
jgi:hypothetical protein